MSDAAASDKQDSGPFKPDMTPENLQVLMNKRVDLAICFFVMALGSYIIFLATHFRLGSFPDPVTSRGLPYITGGMMVLAGAINATRRLLTWHNFPGNLTISEGKEDDIPVASSPIRSFAVIGLCLGWVIGLRPLGYLIVTPLLVIGVLTLMGVSSPIKKYGFTAGFTVLSWLIFSQMLAVILPLGPLTSLARSLGLTP